MDYIVWYDVFFEGMSVFSKLFLEIFVLRESVIEWLVFEGLVGI